MSTFAPTHAAAVAVPRDRTALANGAIGVSTAVGIATLGGAHGGYFPTSWGWCALGLAWLIAMALLVRTEIVVAPLEVATVAAFAGLAGWYALSTVWSQSVTQSMLETERALVYPLAAAAALLVCRRASVTVLLGGVWAGISLVSLYALGTRLLPDRLGSFNAIAGHRLAEPLGYWNALGIFSAMGILLALGVAARGHVLARAAASVSLVVLLPTLYLTFSRGAWAALAVGAAAAVAADSQRLQLLGRACMTLIAPVAGVLLVARSHALTHLDALPAAGTRDGHHLALILVALCVPAALAPFAAARLERRFVVPEPVRRKAAATLLVATVAAVVATVAASGGPLAVVHDAKRAVAAPLPPGGVSLNNRLLSLSSSGRNVQWSVAWQTFRAHPLLGTGAGTYERQWLVARPLGIWKIRDAHSGYLETMAELGIVGFALLCAAFVLPLAAVRRARHHPLASVAAGAYAAYLLHAAVDWDWEMTAVTTIAVLCGVALLLAARTEKHGRDVTLARRIPVLMVVVAAGAFAAVGLLGNVGVGRSAAATRAQQWSKAERDAVAARRWAPWSSQPLLWLGEAQVGAGRLVEARATLHRAIAKDRGDWELWFDLALAERRGSAAQTRALREALRLNPLSPEVREFVAGAGLRLPGVGT
jgi:hypothetical protein